MLYCTEINFFRYFICCWIYPHPCMIVEFTSHLENTDHERLYHPLQCIPSPCWHQPHLQTKDYQWHKNDSWESPETQDTPPLSCQKLTGHTPQHFLSLELGTICAHHNHPPPPTNGDRNDNISNYCTFIYIILLKIMIEMEMEMITYIFVLATMSSYTMLMVVNPI